MIGRNFMLVGVLRMLGRAIRYAEGQEPLVTKD
jgi:hypothetical protein